MLRTMISALYKNGLIRFDPYDKCFILIDCFSGEKRRFSSFFDLVKSYERTLPND